MTWLGKEAQRATFAASRRAPNGSRRRSALGIREKRSGGHPLLEQAGELEGNLAVPARARSSTPSHCFFRNTQVHIGHDEDRINHRRDSLVPLLARVDDELNNVEHFSSSARSSEGRAGKNVRDMRDYRAEEPDTCARD